MTPPEMVEPLSLADNESRQPDLNHLFNKCVEGFRAILRILLAHKTQSGIGAEVPVISPGEVDRAYDEYGRLMVWGHDFRASVPDRTRSSLGETLRQTGELRRQVVSIFMLLDTQIRLILYILSKGSNHTSPSLEALEDDSDSSSDSESAVSGTDSDLRQRTKASKVSRLMTTIFDQIKLLYHFGILLRRPGLGRRYFKSGPRKDHSHLDATPEDLSHVQETMKQWKKEPGHDTGIHPDDEKEVTWEDILGRIKTSTETESLSVPLIDRLARANTIRRQQLIYWSEYPDQVLQPEAQRRPIQHTNFEDAKSVKSTGTSLFSKNTVALSDIAGRSQRQSGDEPARTVYADTVISGMHSTRVPDVPKESHSSDTFECPYCHIWLDSAPMRGNRNMWKRHVFRDLRPYTCTFTSCASGDKLYATKHDWMYHEMQVHRRQWNCGDCNLTLLSRDDMARHLTSVHSGTWGNGQLPIILGLNERPLDDMHPSQCPFCPMSGNVKFILEHLGKHMEDISLFVLPLLEGGEDEHEPNKHTIHVNGLHEGLTEDMLRQIFESTGHVRNVKIIPDDSAKGYNYGFVQYDDPGGAERAIMTLNGRRVHQREIRVSWAYLSNTSNKEDTSNHFHVFVGDLSNDVNDEILLQTFSAFGSVSEARVLWDMETGRSRGYGFVAFRDRPDAEKAISSMDGALLYSRTIRCNWAKQKGKPSIAQATGPTPTIPHGHHQFPSYGIASYDDIRSQTPSWQTTCYVGNLAPSTTSNDVVPLFRNFGYVIESRFQADRGYAFIKMDTHENAAMAICQMTGYSVNGRPLKCSWGKDRPPS